MKSPALETLDPDAPESGPYRIGALPREVCVLVGCTGGSNRGAPDHRVVLLEELERSAIFHALAVAEGNVRRAAEMLGIARATFYRRLVSYKMALGEP